MKILQALNQDDSLSLEKREFPKMRWKRWVKFSETGWRKRPCGRNWRVLWTPFQDSSGPFLKNLKLQWFLRRMRMRTRLPQKCRQIEDADPASRVPIKFYIITVSTVQHTQNYIYSLSLLVDVCHHPGRMWTFFFKTEAHKDQATNYSYTREPGMLHADGNRKWHFK